LCGVATGACHPFEASSRSPVLVEEGYGGGSGAQGGGPERDEGEQCDDADSQNRPAVGYERQGKAHGKGEDREPTEWRAVRYDGESVRIGLCLGGPAVELAA
jgi:hypothetical protein